MTSLFIRTFLFTIVVFFGAPLTFSHALAQIGLGKDSLHYLDGVLWTE